MQQIKVDYIIIGQGIAGSWLSYELIKRNKAVMVINQDISATSSKKAAGLYNPITGRKMVKTWRADDLFLHLEDRYRELEEVLDARFLHPMPIYRPFRAIADANDWQGKYTKEEYGNYIQQVTTKSLGRPHIQDPYGGIVIDKCGYVDLPKLLAACKNYLDRKGMYREEVFELSKMDVTNQGVKYKTWKAEKVIFCEGPKTSSLWNELPFRPVRGEVIDISCDLSTDLIFNQGVFVIPKGEYFTVGSTYDHSLLTFEPQESGILNIQERLSKIFVGDYRILNKRAGVRPATHDRRPYIGFHKKNKTLAIFNGFGSKGVSLTPYFANHFAEVLVEGIELEKEVNVERVYH